MSRRLRALIIGLIFIIALATGLGLWYFSAKHRKEFEGTIKVGILHSMTGAMAVTEKPIIDAVLLAIDEINGQGGLLHKKIIPVIRDGKTDWPTYATEAERLIKEEKVTAIFGAYTSASRKMVKPIVEEHNSLLFYPAQYEGLETSKNIVYLGATANQQAIPATIWCLQNLGKRFFLVGSDYVYPRAIHSIIRHVVSARNGSVVGEEYISPKQNNFADIIDKIITASPDVIINNIVGEQNNPFFKALRVAGISSEKIPTMSLVVTETELAEFNIDALIGDYGAQNYFQSLNTPTNNRFVSAFKKKYGANRVISNHMENAYLGVYFYKFAVTLAQTTETDAVREQLSKVALNAPEEIISIDKNQHIWKAVLIGKIFPNKQFGIVWNSVSTIPPNPYPPFESIKYWDDMLARIFVQYGNKWWKE